MYESSKIWYKLRGALIVPFYLFTVFYFSGEFEKHRVIITLGSLLFSFGLLLRIWAQTHLHYRLKEHKKLTMTGPYVYVRNPIYIGNTFIMAGLTVLTGLFWFVPVMVLACACTYHMTVLYEEAHLTMKYGQDYIDFTRRIPRWIPLLHRRENEATDNFREYIFPSILAELHILLLPIPFFLRMLFQV